jgi:hypothetical protein
MRDCPPPWHKPNLGAQIPWPRLSVEVWNDGSLAYKITRIYPVPFIATHACSETRWRTSPLEKTCKFSAKWALAARKDPEKAPLVVHCAAGISRSTAIAMIPLIAYYESAYLAARRLYQIREFAQPNTHVLYLIHQTLSLEENIYEVLFQAQNPGLFD